MAKSTKSFIGSISRNGLMRASTPDKRIWLYARVPAGGALLEGAQDKSRAEAASTLDLFFDGLANLVPQAATRNRDLMQSKYREFHLLTASMPIHYQIPAALRGTELGVWLSKNYKNENIQRQFTVIGVPLINNGFGFGRQYKHASLLRKSLVWTNRMAYSIKNHAPRFDEYDEDTHRIERIMLDAGLEPFTRMDRDERDQLIQQVSGFWVSNNNVTDLPIMAESDHIHLFADSQHCATAERLYEQHVDCRDWNMRGQMPATLCTVTSTSFHGDPIISPENMWGTRLMTVATAGGANAIAVSVRGRVEPAPVTASQIRKNGQSIDQNTRKRAERGHEATGEMIDTRRDIASAEDMYTMKDMPATLIDLSCVVLADGESQDATDSLLSIGQMEFAPAPTANEQLMQFKSMQVCSPVRIPSTLEWSSTMVTGAGFTSFAVAGDASGVFLGMTEANEQPVYISPTAVQDESKAPFFVIVGQTGSGKSMVLVNLMRQFAMTVSRTGGRTCAILINPKSGNDFETIAEHIIRIDKDISAGTFDPFNVLPNMSEAIELAATIINDIFQFGATDQIDVQYMISYGAQHGAKTTGQALQFAAQAYQNHEQGANLPESTPRLYETIVRAWESSQQLRLIIGMKPVETPLRISEGLTLINAGERSLIPEKDAANTVSGRIKQWVLRMIVTGAGYSVRGRDGVVALDEAWVAVNGSSGTAATLQEWERMARSQRFLPILASQKVKEFVDAGLSGGISRGLILSLKDLEETNGMISDAKSALRLFHINDDHDRLRRRMPLDAVKKNGEANYQSMRAFTDPHTGQTRGSVAFFIDGNEQPVPVRIDISAESLALTGTSALEKIRREQAQGEVVSRG